VAVVSVADAVQDMPSQEMIWHTCYCIMCSVLVLSHTMVLNRKKMGQSITLLYPLSCDNNICTCTLLWFLQTSVKQSYAYLKSANMVYVSAL